MNLCLLLEIIDWLGNIFSLMSLGLTLIPFSLIRDFKVREEVNHNIHYISGYNIFGDDFQGVLE